MMNEDRRARLIAQIISHLEEMDGNELGDKMKPPMPEGDGAMVAVMGKEGEEPGEGSPEEEKMDAMEGDDKGPMDSALDEASNKSRDANTPAEGEEMDDDELEELMKMSS